MSDDAKTTDERFMAAAIRLSLRNLGMTGDNPSVGALIVRDGAIVGRGVTAPGGRPHAERQAVAEAGEAARGATAYVTLEPCSHFGRSPPCADALLQAGIRRVVVAIEDPDPRVAGRGVRQLREAGVDVETGCLAPQAERAMEGFLSLKRRGRPFLALKLAVSADGFLGWKGQGNVPITGPLARAAVHAQRREHEAVMVGVGTILADDPRLDVRLPGFAVRTTRIVIDPQARTPATARLFANVAANPVVIIATSAAPAAAIARLKEAGAQVLVAQADWRGEIRPQEILRLAGMLGIKSVYLEGGAETARRFLEAGQVDRLLLFRGAASIGATDAVASPVRPDNPPQGFRLAATSSFGDDRLQEFGRM